MDFGICGQPWNQFPVDMKKQCKFEESKVISGGCLGVTLHVVQRSVVLLFIRSTVDGLLDYFVFGIMNYANILMCYLVHMYKNVFGSYLYT